MVVDLGVREVAAFLAQLNERAHLALTLFILLRGHCDIGLHRAGLALSLVRPPAGALHAGATMSSSESSRSKLAIYFLLDRFARRRQIPGASITARDDFDDSFDHRRLAENRIEQSTQTAFARGLRFSIALLGAAIGYTNIALHCSTDSANFIGLINLYSYE